MKIMGWINRKLATLSLAFANVEKNALSQNAQSLSSDTNQVQRHTQGQLADSLVHGEVTQEVIDLRWRTYKILQHVDKLEDKENELRLIKTEPSDSYQLEMVVDNDEIKLGATDVFKKEIISGDNSPTKSKNDEGEDIALHGSVDSTTYFAMVKGQPPINIGRDFFPKFKIENFTKTLHVRHINGSEKLLEFYVSKYPNDDNKRSRLFINEVKKCIVNPVQSNMLDILEVDFVTFNTIGKSDNLFYKYNKLTFYKICEFNGFYVIKFKANEIVSGEDILFKYKVDELDDKYNRKDKK